MHLTQAEAMKKLTELVKDIKIAMLTTIEADGNLHSRPMGTQEMRDGTLWFFLKDDSRKAVEVVRDPRVNVSYVDSNTWVSVSGTATITHDRAMIDELWNESLNAWFPKGKDEPHLALMKVRLDEGEYWDVTSSSMVQLFSYLKSKLTGAPHEGEFAEHEVVRG
jgi:general stress protein 26